MAAVKKGDRLHLKIIQIENPGCIWAREVLGDSANERVQQYDDLKREINMYFNDFSTQRIPVTNPVHNLVCIARRDQDRVWHRVRVEDRIGNSRVYSCFMLDEGLVEPFNQEWLRQAPPQFTRTPYQAKHYKLAGIKPLSLQTSMDLSVSRQPARRWDPIATTFIMKQLQAHPDPEAEVMHVQNTDTIHARLYLGADRACLNDQLVQKQYAYSTQEYDTPENSADEKGLSSSVPKATLTEVAKVPETNSAPSPTRPPTGGTTTIQSPPKSIGRGILALAQMKVSTPPSPGSGTELPTVSREQVGSPRQGAGSRHGAGRGLLSMPGVKSEAPPQLAGIKPLTKTNPAPPATVNVADQGPSMPVGRGRGRIAMMTALGIQKPSTDSKPQEESLYADMPQLEDTDSSVLPTSDYSKQTHPTQTIPINDNSTMGATRKGVSVSNVQSDPEEIMAKLIGEPDTKTTPQGTALTSPSCVQPKYSPNREAIPVPKVVEESSRIPSLRARGSPAAVQSGTDSDSQLESRLPKFARQRNAGSSRIGGASRRSERGSGSDSQNEPPQQAMVEAERPRGVTFSDGDETPRPSRRPVERDVSPPKSILKPPDPTCMLENRDRDSSPEREDDESVPIFGHRKEYLDRLLYHTPDSDMELLTYTYFSDQDVPTNDDLGVLLDGEVQPAFMQNTKLLFDSTMNKVIDRLDIMPTNLQSYCWPALLRLRNVVGVSSTYRPAPTTGGAKQGGTTFAYLVPLVAQLRQKSVYAGVPAGVGPLALVLCSSWEKVQLVFNQVHKLLGHNIHLRTIPIYGAGSEENQEVRLINGCELLVATPKCLLRMLDRAIVETKRLCHVVLDDGDKLIEYQQKEVEEILTRYEDCMETQEDRTAPRQIVLMGKHWTQAVHSFMMKHLPDPSVVIASMAESAIYCQVKKIVRVIRADQRLTQLAGMFEASTLKKTIIFTDSPLTAEAVHESLTTLSVFAILCHEDLPLTTQDAARRDWAAPTSPCSPSILVMTDTMLGEAWDRDAEMVIHYDPPLRKDYFGPRLWCMYKNFQHPLQPAEEPKEPTSILLVTEEWKPYISLVIKDLRHSDQPVPDALSTLADRLITSKEKDKYTDLCRAFKAFGRCSFNPLLACYELTSGRCDSPVYAADNFGCLLKEQQLIITLSLGMENSCTARHSIQRQLDTPGLQQLHQPLPTSGHVKVLITSVEDANRLWGRLLEHKGGGEVTDHRSTYTKFCFAMHMHYSEPENRAPCGYPNEGELYVVEDKQHTYNRVQIVKIQHKYNTRVIEQVYVRMVDSGNLVSVDPSELLVIHPNFLRIPFQAVEMYVCGVKPIDDDVKWTNHANDLVFSQVFGKQLDGRIVLTLGNTLWLDPLVKRELLKEVGTVIHSVACHNCLLKNDLAQPNPEHMKLLYKACQGNVDLPDVLSLHEVPHMALDAHGKPTTLRTTTLPEKGPELESVEVTAVLHPGLFYARLAKNVKKLDELHEAIRNHVKLNLVDADALKSLRPGSLILATSPQDEEEEEVRMWYRAKLRSIDGDQYDVFYLDTGESEYVTANQVRPLPPTFTHEPFQAIECNLPHVAPLREGGEWGDDVGDPFWFLVSDSGGQSKPLLAEVIETGQALNIGLTKYSIRLFDTNAEFDIDIAQELVTQGHARPLPGMIKSEMPPVDETVTATYKNLPTLCAELVLSTDYQQRIMVIDQIQKIIRTNQNDVEGMCRCRAVGALCQALGYLSNMEIVELLCKCLILLTKLDHSVFDAILKDDGVTTLCRILARADTTGHRVVTSTISDLVQQQRLREQFVGRGILRLLSSLLYNMDTEHPETIKHALISIREVSLALTERHRTIVLRSGCVAALCHCLEHSSDHLNRVNCLLALKSLFSEVRVQEESRRWALPVLCKCVEEAVERPRLANPVVLALCALARGSRINKETMLDYNIINALRTLSSSPLLKDDARSLCMDLHDSLTTLRRITEYPEIPPDMSPVTTAATDSQDTDEENNADSQHGRGDYSNIPIPTDALNLITKRATPEVKWFQDRRNLILLIQLKNVHGNLNVTIKKRGFEFRAVVERVEYVLNLQLFEEINPDRCETQVRPGEVRVGLRKMTSGNWPRVTSDKSKPPYLSPDFGRYIEESESDSEDSDHGERNKESPLDLIERCQPRPPSLPVPPADYVSLLQPGQFHPYDPHDDPNYKSPSSEDSDDERDRGDEHEEDLQRQFFNL